ncbi:hypothetical protein E8E13_001687 [Curvularia kusanoi]|uniref:BZIP domain-containing protein n=1 Tax=Curvularia kusanoi TaxID=90978 RepID=A0A9P4TDU4_CURKU|nr:hypothetical protein E8E13_001687 [Curvularia kusanoi]
MELVAQRHLEWTEQTPSAPKSHSPIHWHDDWNPFRSATEEALDLFPHSLSNSSLGMAEHFSHNEQNPPSKKLRGHFVRDTSVPVEHLLHEALWPESRLEGSQQSPDGFGQGHRPSLLRQELLKPMLADSQTDAEAPHSTAEANSSRSQPPVAPGTGKRKRGRPRLHPSPSDANGADVSYEDISESRIVQLEKNRLAAEKCRQKRKVYTAGLSAEVSILSTKNESLKAEEVALREELLSLKNEILGHARCGSSIIDGYIAKSAGSQLTAEKRNKALPRRDSGQECCSSGHSGESSPGDLTSGKDVQSLFLHEHSTLSDSYGVFESFHDLVNAEEH